MPFYFFQGIREYFVFVVKSPQR